MNLEEYDNFYHVDISTQIENKWKNDTVLAVVKDNQKYSIKIRSRDKKIIKKRFIVDEPSKILSNDEVEELIRIIDMSRIGFFANSLL